MELRRYRTWQQQLCDCLTSDDDSVGGKDNAGSVMLVNGATGALIKTLVGDQEDD